LEQDLEIKNLQLENESLREKWNSIKEN
jgi:hypothetical protein